MVTRSLIAKLACLLGACLAVAPCLADVNVLPVGSRAAALGNAGVVNADVFAVYNNQAALGFLAAPEAALHYENRYFSEELGLSAAAFATPIPVVGVLGLSVCSFGYSLYRETRVGAAVGKRLSPRMAVGAQLNYHLVQVAGYGSTYALTGEAGLLAEPLDNLWVGAHVFNLTSARYFSDAYLERLPVAFDVGMGYHAAPHVGIFLAAKISSTQAAQASAGVEVLVAKVLAVRLGVQLKPVEIYAGFGYTYRRLRIDMAFSRHEALGYSPQLSLSYCFPPKSKPTPP
ncbi:MAG: hypothetical protein LBS63_01435 [Prevotellaceae bacterium]|jgi:hypothetical protein|nr:hypothetical protein [Prevotellaceae bacterium]